MILVIVSERMATNLVDILLFAVGRRNKFLVNLKTDKNQRL